MKKKPDMYLEVHPWMLIEKSFHENKSRVSESLFSLSNEYLGIRGFFEEGYSGDSLRGLYLNGVYEEKFTENSSYRGISNRLCFMVNTLDWLYSRFSIDGECLDLNLVKWEHFQRTLDFRSGEICREFVWITATGKSTKCVFKRFLSMTDKEKTYQSMEFFPLNWSGDIHCTTGLDYSIKHESFEKSFWEFRGADISEDDISVLLETENTGFLLRAGFQTFLPPDIQGKKSFHEERVAGIRFILNVEEGINYKIQKRTHVLREAGGEALGFREKNILKRETLSYAEALALNKLYWDEVWERSDIEIGGDPVNQQGIRFCIFQMYQTYNGGSPGTNIGAKGLTGEAYNGNAFWDTETYCLPFYLFNNRKAARSLLEYRYRTLDQARARAGDLDCSGACYPVATLDGTESCTLWQHASLQFQPTTAVAYAVRHYYDVTGDREFLYDMGLEMLLEISRFLADRVQWSPGKNKYGYYGVMGPDEFQVMVNNNCYTNFMGLKSLEFSLRILDELYGSDKVKTNKVIQKVGLKEGETDLWREIVDKMYIPYDEDSLIFEQHEGFSDLPHIDVGDIPLEDFPLYHSWSYDRIYRNDMIKQPDVLMFMLLYNQSFSKAQKNANYNYYEPRCIHESSLSPSVHSILALELEKYSQALNFFRFATRIDLDNYNRNTREGLHTTAIAAAWMNIVYGFAGFRSDGEIPLFDPVLPENWTSLKLSLHMGESRVDISISPKTTELRVSEGKPVFIMLRGNRILLDNTGTVLSTKVAI